MGQPRGGPSQQRTRGNQGPRAGDAHALRHHRRAHPPSRASSTSGCGSGHTPSPPAGPPRQRCAGAASSRPPLVVPRLGLTSGRSLPWAGVPSTRAQVWSGQNPAAPHRSPSRSTIAVGERHDTRDAPAAVHLPRCVRRPWPALRDLLGTLRKKVVSRSYSSESKHNSEKFKTFVKTTWESLDTRLVIASVVLGMAMAAGASLFRSVATKMASPPPRPPTSSGGLCLPSRFSTSTSSTPSSANLNKGPQTYNKEVPCGNEWDWFIAGVKSAAPKAACGLVVGGFAFIHFYVIPALDRIDAQMNALCDKLVALSKEMKMRREQSERVHAALDTMGSQIEARDVVGEFSKGQKIQASGQFKEHL